MPKIRGSFDWLPAARLVTCSPLMFEPMHHRPPIHSEGKSISYSDTLNAAPSRTVDIAHLSLFP